MKKYIYNTLGIAETLLKRTVGKFFSHKKDLRKKEEESSWFI